jgi:hypothetical protein
MVDFNEQSSGRPGVHLEGPAAILRTISQTKPPRQPAIRLQLQLCFLAVCIALIWSILPYPPNIGTSSNILKSVKTSRLRLLKLFGAVKAQSQEDLPAADLILIVGCFIELHARVKRSEISDPERIIQFAPVCELELEQWEQHLPEIWRPEIIFSTKPEAALHNRQHGAYRDAWNSRIWSRYHWS